LKITKIWPHTDILDMSSSGGLTILDIDWSRQCLVVTLDEEEASDEQQTGGDQTRAGAVITTNLWLWL